MNIENVRERKFFKFIDTSNVNDTSKNFILCICCTNHLTFDRNEGCNENKNIWPGFIWYFLNDERLVEEYGKEHLWKFIPVEWRKWWFESMNLSLESSTSYFCDIYTDIQDWNSLISSHTLPNLRDACNQYLLPKVLCPYGCSCFMHKCGSISIDLIFQRFLLKVEFKKYMNNKKFLSHVASVRDDYLRCEGNYDCWLLNKEWMILPSISFIDGVPQVLTCMEHDKGTNKLMIHPLRIPNHIIPSFYSDQMSHCVIRSRTIKPMKSSIFSNGYQMHEQRGCFNGIDTCNVTTFRRFNIPSKLLRDSQVRSMFNRPDINALLNQFVEEKVLSKNCALLKRSYAEIMGKKINFEQYSNGGTYVPLEHTIMMKRDLINLDRSLKVIIDNRLVILFIHYFFN